MVENHKSTCSVSTVCEVFSVHGKTKMSPSGGYILERYCKCDSCSSHAFIPFLQLIEFIHFVFLLLLYIFLFNADAHGIVVSKM